MSLCAKAPLTSLTGEAWGVVHKQAPKRRTALVFYFLAMLTLTAVCFF